MNEDETLNNVAMLISGSRTTLTLLGNGLLTLLRQPGAIRQAAGQSRADANRDRGNAALRTRQQHHSRAAVNDFQCGSVRIPAGCVGHRAGRRDQPRSRALRQSRRRSTSRETPTTTRRSAAARICIGKALARMTTQIAFNALMDRFQKIELAGEPLWWTDRSDQRGLERLPLSAVDARDGGGGAPRRASARCARDQLVGNAAPIPRISQTRTRS